MLRRLRSNRVRHPLRHHRLPGSGFRNGRFDGQQLCHHPDLGERCGVCRSSVILDQLDRSFKTGCAGNRLVRQRRPRKNAKYNYIASADRYRSPQTTTTDSAFGSFEKVTYTQFNGLQSPFGITSTSYGSCTVSTFRGDSASVVDPITSSAVSLDAGAALSVTGPGGTKQIAKTASGKTIIYDATLGGGSAPSTPLFLNAGSYSITAPGGSGTNAVGAFTANVTLPQPLTWTNASSISTVTRANGQLVKWSGGDPNGSVYIDGFSFLLGTNPNGSDTLGAIFICTAKVTDTQFNIPPNVLLSIPPSSTTSIGGIAFSFSSLSVSTGSYQSFTAPGLDVGIISAGSSSSETVTYQ